jgi:hypothetical protein
MKKHSISMVSKGVLLSSLWFVDSTLSLTQAQDYEFKRASPKELPVSVKSATVQAEVKVLNSDGATFAIRRIEPPVLPPPPSPPRVVGKLTPEQEEARDDRAKMHSKVFSPSIVVFPSGVSLLNWRAMDSDNVLQSFEAWVGFDLSSIHACSDFEVGLNHYTVLAFAYPATYHTRLGKDAPTPDELSHGYRLTLGDPENSEALEPLLSIIQLYTNEGDDIAADYAAFRAYFDAREKWETDNPEPVRDSEIRLWPVQSTEYSTEKK